MKARYPCRFDPNWHIDASQASELGLSPEQARDVERAFVREEARIRTAIERGCAKVVGSLELAQRLGPAVCTSIVTNAVTDNHADTHMVANIRAGNRPIPPADQLTPFASLLLAETEALRAIQEDLAPSLGPEDAHRIAFEDAFGSCSGTFNGPPPRQP